MSDVSYIELSYGGEIKKLNNKLAKLLNSIDNNSIDQQDSSISDNATGEQAYNFVFYNKNKEELYRLLFTESRKEIIIFREEDSKLEMHYINDENILKCVMNEVENLNNEF